MTTKFATLQNYKYNVAASALLFSNLNNKALRVEVPDLGKEFSVGKFIGHGGDSLASFFSTLLTRLQPEGTLYHNDLNSFDISRKNLNYKVVKVDRGAGAIPLVRHQVLPPDRFCWLVCSIVNFRSMWE